MFTSHEALLLGFEQAMTRVDSTSGDWYDTSAHLVWIGERTRQPDGAHIEFLRGVKNPVGLKVRADDGAGRSAPPDAIALNPARTNAGRLDAVSAASARKRSAARLPRHDGRHAPGGAGKVVWATDPMHGNTLKAANGYKTRPFDRILLRGAHASSTSPTSEGVHPGGVHLEMTGQNVTECLGGARELTETELADRYHTHCDPRLNADQALELAFLVAEKLHAERGEAERMAV